MRNAPLLLFGAIAIVLGALFYFLLGPSDGPPDSTGPDLGPALVSEVEPGTTRSTDLSGVSADSGGDERRAVTAEPMSLDSTGASTTERAGEANRPGIRGRVTNSSGLPLEGARVIAAGGDGLPMDFIASANTGFGQRWTATTKADGSFVLKGPAPGALRLAVRLAGYAPLDAENLTLPAGGGADFGDLSLEDSVVLEGRVTVAGGGAVAGAELYREATDDGSGFRTFFAGVPQHPVATTDSAGRFRVDMLAAGPWKLRVESQEHPDRSFEGRTERPGELRGGLEFELEQGAAITGMLTGAPAESLADVVVRATPKGRGGFGMMQGYRQAEVAADGSFRIGGCSPGKKYALQARLDEASGPRWGGEQKTRTKSVEAVGGQSGLTLVWSGTTGVELSVARASDGLALEDFTVSYGAGFLRELEADGETVEHHPGGKVLLDELPTGGWSNGPFKVRIQAAGFETLEREFDLIEGEVLAGGLMQLEAAPVLTVRVLDASTKQPVEGADVALMVGGSDDMQFMIEGMGSFVGEGNETATNRGSTGADGVAVLTSFPGEVARLRVRHAAHTDWDLEGLALPASGSAEQEVLLGVGGTVVVRVLDAFGAPLPGASVEQRTPPEPKVDDGQFGSIRAVSVMGGPTGAGIDGPNRVTDQDGIATFTHLVPGPHEFRLGEAQTGGMVVFFSGMGDAGESWTLLEVEERGEHELTLQEKPQSVLAGRVLEAGAPLAGATLSLAKRKEDTGSRGMRGLRGFNFAGMGGDNATSDGRGGYRIEGVEPGDYTLTVDHPSRVMPMEYDLVLVAGENTKDVDLPLAIIEGRVTRPDGTPMADVKVEVRTVDGSAGPRMAGFMVMSGGGSETSITVGDDAADPTVTDADGRYRLRGVTTGVELIVRADDDEAAPAESEPLELADGELERGVDLVLTPAGAIAVEVRGLEENSFPLLTLTAIADDGSEGEPQTSFAMDGKESFGGLEPGSYRVGIQVMNQGSGFGGGDAAEPQLVEVVAGETTPVTFDL